MNILVVGPGALGGLFSILLSRGGHAVALFDHTPDRAAALAREGLTLQEAEGSTLHIHLPVTADIAAVPHALDLVCLCVKSIDTAGAMRSVRDAVGPDTAVITLQNGLGHAEVIEALIPAGQIACAVTYHGATLAAPGRIVHAGEGETLVADWGGADRGDARPPHDGSSSPAGRFAEALRRAGMGCRVVPDVRAMLWRKLLVNAAINPMAALHGVRNGELVERPEWCAELAAAAVEVSEVALRLGIALDVADPAAEVLAACRRTSGNMASMLQDIRRGRRTEIEALNGQVVAHARRVGLAVPVNERLLAEVRALERARGGASVLFPARSV